MYLWRAVDGEGEVLHVLVQARRNKKAAPIEIATDKLRSYGAAFRGLGLTAHHDTGQHENNSAENSHQPVRRRERKMAKFRGAKSLQKFASIHSSVHNHFNQERHLYNRQTFKLNRPAALAEWRQLYAA